ncbi:hypothetical protein [uncultured Chryseobacterium sp.]|uniref:hypothetical protein n=1 Tax=uncultured Chryseobacterium sp. TaxID=259322 RepID=UPI0025DE1EF3|nr:hypothetical protein [uncultured Chryseobacterium sp.]
MKRHYFYKNNKAQENMKYLGDIIDFQLHALFSEDAISNRTGRKFKNFKYFDQIKIILNPKSDGIYNVKYDSGSDGSSGHFARSLGELKKTYEEDGFKMISEREYFRLRELAVRLIFKHINFLKITDSPERRFFVLDGGSRYFYDYALISISIKENIKNYPPTSFLFCSEKNLPVPSVRVDEEYRIFLNNSGTKSNSFEIQSSHFNPYYDSFKEFEKSSLYKQSDKKTIEIKDFQFQRIKRIFIEGMLEVSSLDISSLIKKQNYTIRVFD